MNSKTLAICIYSTLLVGFVSGQNAEQLTGNRVILSVGSINNANFYIYNPPFKAKPVYSGLSQVKNKYPEELMMSIISARDQEWLDFNILGGAEHSTKKDKKYFESVKNMNPDSNYLELRTKFGFEYLDSKMAIVKYYLHKEGIPEIAGAYVMQQVGDRWYRTSTAFTTDFAIIMTRIKDGYMKTILEGKTTNDAVLNDIIAKSSEQGKVQIQKLVKVINDIIENNESVYNYLKDPKSW